MIQPRIGTIVTDSNNGQSTRTTVMETPVMLEVHDQEGSDELEERVTCCTIKAKHGIGTL